MLLDSADKELSLTKQRTEEATSMHSNQLSTMETKLLKLEMEASKTQKEYEQLLEDQHQLQVC